MQMMHIKIKNMVISDTLQIDDSFKNFEDVFL